MKRLLALALMFGSACGGGEAAAPPGPTPEEALQALLAAVAAQQAKPEHQDAEVTIQHCLIGVAGRGTAARHSPEEACALAAQVYARALAGEDFDLLVKNHTDDSHPGLWTLSLEPATKPGVFARKQMVPAFGDTAWRLAVGEIGVAAYDGDAPQPKSPFGWHIVKRTK
jgi:hypothetical protein